MAVSGFEGFEKRLELHFSGDDPAKNNIMGLRLLDYELLQEVLNAVQCTVVSAIGNHFFDAYVLSESSLFVYPTKVVIKTCGTTQLIKSIRPLIIYAHDLGLTLSACRYTRGSFIFPKAQPFPHSSFKEEVVYIEENLPTTGLHYRKATVLPSKLASHSWHVFTAGDDTLVAGEGSFTVEICMTDLDKTLAGNFFLNGGAEGGDTAGKEMTVVTGIDNINPDAIICDFAFDPCGYSMNGIDGDRYSTIHVTPEDGYSYASYECVGSIYDDQNDVAKMLTKVVQVFRPGTMTVSTTARSDGIGGVWPVVKVAAESVGMKCRSCVMDEFPANESVVFQMFTARRKRV